MHRRHRRQRRDGTPWLVSVSSTWYSLRLVRAGRIKRYQLPLPFAQIVCGVPRDVLEPVNASRRPAHLERLGALGLPQAEMQSRVAGGKKTPPSETLGHLAASPGRDGHVRPDRVAVRARPFQLKRQEMPGRPLIMEVGQGFARRDDQKVETAVIVNVS
jgi:hypothetical protein